MDVKDGWARRKGKEGESSRTMMLKGRRGEYKEDEDREAMRETEKGPGLGSQGQREPQS